MTKSKRAEEIHARDCAFLWDLGVQALSYEEFMQFDRMPQELAASIKSLRDGVISDRGRGRRSMSQEKPSWVEWCPTEGIVIDHYPDGRIVTRPDNPLDPFTPY
jgi:hypothetical protein